MHKYDIAASIVAYKNEPSIINNAIKSFLDTPLNVHLLVIDNSPTNSLKDYLPHDPRLSYLFNNENLGFSKAHNQGIRYFSGTCKYFLVLNPDVYFSSNTLLHLFDYLEQNPATGLIAPRVHYPDGKLQTSRRLIPSPIDLIIRRLPLVKTIFKKRVSINEYLNSKPKQIAETPFLLGCFMLFRMSVFNKAGLFDERYFMYLEDLDMCRRISRHSSIVYHGETFIFHLYQRASAKNLKMFAHHAVSMVKYFNKWGWLKDLERIEINNRAQKLNQHNTPENEVLYAVTAQ